MIYQKPYHLSRKHRRHWILFSLRILMKSNHWVSHLNLLRKYYMQYVLCVKER